MANPVENEIVPNLFVAQIPKFAKEEDLLKVFTNFGPVVHFKLLRNSVSRESLGAGLCKFVNNESLLRVLQRRNSIHYHGHKLRVESDAQDAVRKEIENLLSGPQPLSRYGPECAPEAAPFIITNTMASMPPERLHEVLRETKQCIHQDPTQVAKMLVANPQLAYALTTAMAMTGVVREDTAEGMIIRNNNMEPLFAPPPPPQETPCTWPLPHVPQHHPKFFGDMHMHRPIHTFRPGMPHVGQQMPHRAPQWHARYPRNTKFCGPHSSHRARDAAFSRNPERGEEENFLYGNHAEKSDDDDGPTGSHSINRTNKKK